MPAGAAVTARWSRSTTATAFSTRYGHLSQIDVKVGDDIRIGQVVGRLGSTGRSTGPHLHYETRIDGEAVTRRSSFMPAPDCMAGANSGL